MADILIAHGTVITLDPRRRVIEDGAVLNGQVTMGKAGGAPLKAVSGGGKDQKGSEPEKSETSQS